MSVFAVGWLLWIAAFIGLEGAALKRKAPGDTLSEYVWAFFSVTGKGRAWQARRFALLAGVTWLAAHFLTGGAF